MKVIQKNSVAEQQRTAIDPALGDYIRNRRQELGMTIKELAEKINCSPTHVTRIELHQRKCDSMQLLVDFANALNVPTERLLDLAGQALPESDDFLRRAIPSIKNDYQKQIITEFAQLITGNSLTKPEMQQLILQATAMVEFFENHRAEIMTHNQ
jgi:transcriptional regulator with XRE-family HTH domain